MTHQQQNVLRDLINSANAALLACKTEMVLGEEYGKYLADSIAAAKSVLASLEQRT